MKPNRLSAKRHTNQLKRLFFFSYFLFFIWFELPTINLKFCGVFVVCCPMFSLVRSQAKWNRLHENPQYNSLTHTLRVFCIIAYKHIDNWERSSTHTQRRIGVQFVVIFLWLSFLPLWASHCLSHGFVFIVVTAAGVVAFVVVIGWLAAVAFFLLPSSALLFFPHFSLFRPFSSHACVCVCVLGPVKTSKSLFMLIVAFRRWA